MKLFNQLPLLLAAFILGSTVPCQAEILRDIEYARVGNTSLKLDLHLPENPDPILLVHIHGGGWVSGSRRDMYFGNLVGRGFAIASINYRLAPKARFPAQIHDVKAAIRFLRAHSKRLQIDTRRIAAIGPSAGGHLAALAGVAGKELEGTIGDHRDQSSRVQCVVNYFGPADLHTILAQNNSKSSPLIGFLLDGQPSKKPELARLASPVTHIDRNDPPMLMVHGDADRTVPLAQSRQFAEAYRAAKLPVKLVVIPGGKHGGPEFFDQERTEIVVKFLRTHLARR